jgi:hypothetical protein
MLLFLHNYFSDNNLTTVSPDLGHANALERSWRRHVRKSYGRTPETPNRKLTKNYQEQPPTATGGLNCRTPPLQ